MTYHISTDTMNLIGNWIAWAFFTLLAGGIFFGSVKEYYKNPWVIFSGICFGFLIFLAVNFFTQWVVMD